MRLHVHPASAETDAFCFQPQSLLDGIISTQLDFATCSENSLPRQSEGPVQRTRYLAGMAAKSSGSGNCAVG
jgi:hypothetical protein